MSLYTTPLQFGYFFCLLIWILLLIRGYKNQRLSDRLLGWVMFILAMELQDYTFGFAGINFLWDELNGFPRGVTFLFGPIVYFYFLSQTNRSFSFRREHLWHFLPYFFYLVYHLAFFIQGKEVVLKLQESTLDLVMGYVFRISYIISFIYYLSKCLKIHQSYKVWSLGEFSNSDQIDFNWFGNFIYSMIFWLFFREVFMIIDVLIILDFYQDWWWNLALVAVALYIGIVGYSQKQPAQIYYPFSAQGKPNGEPPQPRLNANAKEILTEKEKDHLSKRLAALLEKDRLFLQADLSLHQLSQHLQTNPTLLSATINQLIGMNFNDYINSFRIEEFIKKYQEKKNRSYTLLSLAFDSGFNSKATFNRAFKKTKGCSPQEFFKTQK
ncbi:helix-turn-helix domain-containing protein [Algoriphagus litoralis]|uniref:helix-turn-helix domain-containing protein n=1 Tax=Algoriphagus litoralis TaxID=2202829 RepID=UPI000DBA6F8F|nr:helix-turn-helix domain-containing protein [Algoriphagus litoralis]